VTVRRPGAKMAPASNTRTFDQVGRVNRSVTVGEFVPGYEASTVFGVGAPKNTPAEIVDKLNNGVSNE
jgi:Tripartite tricarboxylate transporter family receptor